VRGRCTDNTQWIYRVGLMTLGAVFDGEYAETLLFRPAFDWRSALGDPGNGSPGRIVERKPGRLAQSQAEAEIYASKQGG